MRLLQVPKGHNTRVDDEEYEALRIKNWYRRVNPTDGKVYIQSVECIKIPGSKKRKTVSTLMHRLIMKAPKGVWVDHIDGDGTNNQKSNLRLCTPQQNYCNRKPKVNSKSGYKGVCPMPGNEGFRARITVRGVVHELGKFKTAKEAARAYNKAAIKYHGEFARLNVIEEGD